MDANELKAELAAKRTKGAVLARLQSLVAKERSFDDARAPAELRTLVEASFSTTLNQRLVATERAKFARRFANASPADWRRATDVLLPSIALSANAALEALTRRPYQEGQFRKPFRAPRSTSKLADVRARWLMSVARMAGEYDADIVWIAERGAHIAGWWGASELGWLLAGAIDGGGETADAVMNILMASASGQHAIGQMGRHVTQALLSCNNPDAWAFVERMLLAAQRDEGLRQTILESVDESHPQAFRRMLKIIVDEKLARFSSVVRAADVWFGFLWDGASSVKVDSILTRALRFLEDPDARTAALAERDAETVYLALWSIAFDDVEAAMAPAAALLSAPSPDVRFIAAHFLGQTAWTRAMPPLVEALGDADLRVASRALRCFATDATSLVDGELLFERLEQLMARTTQRSQTFSPIVWPWSTPILERAHVAAAMVANASHVPAARLHPHVAELEPQARAVFIRNAAGLIRPRGLKSEPAPTRALSDDERRLALELLGDPSPEVRAAAFDAMQTESHRDDEIARLVELLGRKPSDLRNRAIKRLCTLSDEVLFATADALLTDELDLRRHAGLELLRGAAEAGRTTTDVRSRVERYVAGRPSLDDVEQPHVSAILGGGREVASTDDALGLVDVARLAQWPEPRRREIDLDTAAARASLESLATLVLSHAETEVRARNGEVKQLITSGAWAYRPLKREDVESTTNGLPLADMWRQWLRDRGDALRDRDDMELLRALAGGDTPQAWKADAVKTVCGLGPYSAGSHLLRVLLEWCVAWEPPAAGLDFLLDGLETSLASLGDEDFRRMRSAGSAIQLVGGRLPPDDRARAARIHAIDRWARLSRWWRTIFPLSVSPAQATRLYGLMRGFYLRAGGRPNAIQLADFLGAYDAGSADELEFLNLLAGPGSARPRTSLLGSVSSRRPPAPLAERPTLLDAVDRCRRRIVEIETNRGERETSASILANELRWTGGLEALTRAVTTLGASRFARTFTWRGSAASRQETLSRIVLRSVPRDGDTLEAFAEWAKRARIGEPRLVELALYAPQWAAHVNHVMGWPGLESAVWWIHAHTKDARSWRVEETKDVWAAEVSERTPLTAEDLTEGAVDVAWFTQVYAAIGARRWTTLEKAAKYAASSAGHTRARLFAQALAGLVTRDELIARIDSSRHQDAVRALGLLPLEEGDARERDLLARYVRLEEFKREARKFGSARRQSESRAAAIGLDNLARTAGFRDPQRLRWAMEQRAVADLAHGPLVVERDGVSATLSIDADGEPQFVITRSGKPLKSPPAALKKDGDFVALKERLKELERQRSRVRIALEEAMCRGDRFKPAELRALVEHPVLAPALRRLVFLGDDTAGYLDGRGRMLRDQNGAQHVLGGDEDVRIAHSHDLYVRGDWSSWQRECLQAERVQPFKQVFRELYPLTESERGTQRSRRYAGHQVNPRQALALLGGRGWVARPDEGVSRTFHEESLTAWLGFQETFHTPAEVEGLTLEAVVFTKKGTTCLVSLDEVPPRVFSETMRDVDLVVSVAHRGGVDPEATASTVEMRAALVRETAALLGLSNVELQKHHVVIRGALGTYSIHLGSAGVVMLPGTALPVVAVHSQHRGRLFLPFADDDPRTAEVLSKVLLFARDRQIRDPNILAWIRAAGGTEET